MVAELQMLQFCLGVTRVARNRKEHIRRTAQVGHFFDKVRGAGLRWFGHVQTRDSEYTGGKMLKMELPSQVC